MSSPKITVRNGFAFDHGLDGNDHRLERLLRETQAEHDRERAELRRKILSSRPAPEPEPVELAAERADWGIRLGLDLSPDEIRRLLRALYDTHLIDAPHPQHGKVNWIKPAGQLYGLLAWLAAQGKAHRYTVTAAEGFTCKGKPLNMRTFRKGGQLPSTVQDRIARLA